MRNAYKYRPIYLSGLLFMTFACLISIHCANPISPSGGAKDETPPTLDTIGSTQNMQTNFTKQNLFFGFDEWVVVKNPFQQVVISPPLETLPEIKTKGRGVVVLFDEEEEFLENTTYTINFGEAIQDLNEGNVIKNFKFVFSTGNIIDSLFIQGRVVDSREKKPMEDVLVMLYDQMEDSMIYKERPVYFSKTNKDGQFRIENIRQDSFILRALKDENLNYLYDLPTEWIAFLDEPIYITGDTLLTPFKIEVFQKSTPLAISDILDDQFGLIKVALNQEVESAFLKPLDTIIDFQALHEKDSIFGWYQSFPDSTTRFEVTSEDFIDTVSIGPFDQDDKKRRPGFKLIRNNTASSGGRTPTDPVKLIFTNPISTFDTSLVTILFDTITEPAGMFSIDTLDKRELIMERAWKEGTRYQIEALPGAFTDMFGKSTTDTSVVKFRNGEIKNFGNIILNIPKLDTAKSYIVKLMQNLKLIASTRIQGDSSWSKTYALLPPKTYTVQFIEDVNRNGKWDTGDYDLRRIPEPIIIQELEALRAGWDVTADIKTETPERIIK